MEKLEKGPEPVGMTTGCLENSKRPSGVSVDDVPLASGRGKALRDSGITCLECGLDHVRKDDDRSQS